MSAVDDPNESDYSHSDDEEEEVIEDEVQLGFPENTKNPLFHDLDWTKWDGGKVGGFPVWLNPVTIPTTKEMECQQCHDPLTFLLQIYCPVEETDDGFHRSLYLFCCKKRSCIEHESVVCFRNQLPKVNQFCYKDCDTPQAAAVVLPNLCKLCGCRATNSCSICKATHYCSKAHQKLHWKQHKLVCKPCTSSEQLSDKSTNNSNIPAVASYTEQEIEPTDPAQLNYVFPDYEIVVVAEELDEEEELVQSAQAMEGATIWDDAVTKGGEDESSDAAITQTDYNKALGGEAHDPVYINFLTRIQRGGNDQILRYNRWNNDKKEESAAEGSETARPRHGPLLLSSNPIVTEKIKAVPPCEHCGAARAFEFQVMPQLLHFLQVDKQTKIVGDKAADAVVTGDNLSEFDNGEAAPVVTTGTFQNKSELDIDWGSIDVYTCTASCGGGGVKKNTEKDTSTAGGAEAYVYSGYVTEHIIIQPPPETHRKAVVNSQPSKAPTAAGSTLTTILEDV